MGSIALVPYPWYPNVSASGTQLYGDKFPYTMEDLHNVYRAPKELGIVSGMTLRRTHEYALRGPAVLMKRGQYGVGGGEPGQR
eukprot:scaffold2335_cov175-Amphora_coffeaeformis.AAC.15